LKNPISPIICGLKLGFWSLIISVITSPSVTAGRVNRLLRTLQVKGIIARKPILVKFTNHHLCLSLVYITKTWGTALAELCLLGNDDTDTIWIKMAMGKAHSHFNCNI